ncbi:4Fe-4S dicluster domain-containing protein [Hydrogenimonas sp.]
MSSMIKIVVRNILKGPVTDPYPFGPTFEPEALRGKPVVDAAACTACRTCETVCPSGAIRISEEDGVFVHTVWYNTCCYCGNCEFFCPTGAIVLSQDYHTANDAAQKYRYTSVARIERTECAMCGTRFVASTPELSARAYPNPSGRVAEVVRLCPACRKKLAFQKFYQESEKA